MTNDELRPDSKIMSIKKSLPRYMLMFFASFLTAYYMTPVLDNRMYFVHAIMELYCIFIGISTFLLVWHSYSDTLGIFREFGFGLFAASIFYCFHTYFSVKAGITGITSDMNMKYWGLGMFVETTVILDLSLNLKETITNKWKKLFFIFVFSFGLAIGLLIKPDILPDFLSAEGLTKSKRILDCIIIIISLISLYNLKSKLAGDNSKTYVYMFTAVMFVIASELSLMGLEVGNNTYFVFGHLLRMIYYYYLYKAVYVCSIEHPYKKLAESYSALEKANTRINEISNTLNDTLDALPIGILNFERDGRLQYMNKQLEEILACNRDDFYGLSAEEIQDIFPGSNSDVNLSKLIEGNRENAINNILNIKNMNGDNVKLSANSQSISNGVLIFLNEVRKQQEIKYFHLQTQTILNALSNTIFIIDSNKQIILYNDAFRNTFQLGDREIIGMQLEDFNNLIGFKGEPLTAILNSREKVLRPQEISFYSFEGKKHELLNYRAPIVNVEDEIIGAISICTDITEIKKQQHIMQQQEKLAMIGQMAAGIVHEIKNPLATIKGLSQLISYRTNEVKVKEYSEVINSAIDDITKVVNEFLSFAKPKPTVTAKTTINKIVESMQLITETQCYTKNIKSRFNYCSCPMEITADEIKIKQVILNITENAIVAMESSPTPELVVSTYYDTDKREGVIRISDNGIGMRPEVVEKLGTPFFTTKEKGTGLGLGISYQIMIEHKGRIEVESMEGIGTVFRIIFTQIEDML